MIFNAWQFSTDAANFKEASKETAMRKGYLCEKIKLICLTGKNFSAYEMHGKTAVRHASGGVQVHAIYDTSSA